ANLAQFTRQTFEGVHSFIDPERGRKRGMEALARAESIEPPDPTLAGAQNRGAGQPRVIFDWNDSGKQVCAVLFSLRDQRVNPEFVRPDVGVQHGKPLESSTLAPIKHAAPLLVA